MVRVGWLLILCCVTASVARADRVDDLVRILSTAVSHRVRAQAAQVLGKSGDPRAVTILLVALGDANDAVRGSAASALGQLGDPRSVGALERLRSDGSVYVRDSATTALAAIARLATPAPATAPRDPYGPRFFATVYIVKGATDAGQILKEALTNDLAKLPRVATIPNAASARLSAWELQATIATLKTTGERLDCDVELVIVTLPARSIRAKVRAGASLNGVRNPTDLRPQRECLKGASQLLAEDVDKFFKAQL